jgi:hypothetical protein
MTIHPRETEIRQALVAHPELDDRQIGRIAGVNRWSRVRLVREALAAEAPPPPATAAPEPAPPRYPPLGAGSALARSLLATRPSDPTLQQQLRVAYLRSRAIDFGILTTGRS